VRGVRYSLPKKATVAISLGSNKPSNICSFRACSTTSVLVLPVLPAEHDMEPEASIKQKVYSKTWIQCGEQLGFFKGHCVNVCLYVLMCLCVYVCVIVIVCKCVHLILCACLLLCDFVCVYVYEFVCACLGEYAYES
jgi:hypothetical protein